MKRIIFLLFTAFSFSLNLKGQQKLSVRQEKLNIYLKKYRDAIEKAPDSLSKFNIYSQMWKKHMLFIQDTLNFSTYPIYALDTFYFEIAYVKQRTEKNKKYIDVLLGSKYYTALTSFDITENRNPKDIPIYKALLNINQNVPVLAVIHLQDISIDNSNIDIGIRNVMLTLSLHAIQNIK